MELQVILLLTSMTLGFVGWGLVTHLWVLPWLERSTFEQGLALLTVPHVFRYVGLSFLIAGVTTTPLDPRFAVPAAYGDLLVAVLAALTVLAILMKSKALLPLAWLFAVIGFVDFLVAAREDGHGEIGVIETGKTA